MDNIDPGIVEAYGNGRRIMVQDRRGGPVRRGTVSRSTGPAPVYLLMRRRDSVGSTDVLGPNDRMLGYV